MSVAPTETPERLAFYDRIDKDNMTPLWSVLGDLVTPEPKSGCQSGGMEVRYRAGGDDGSWRVDHREGSRAPRADLREPRPQRAVEDNHVALCRRAARAAGRSCAGAPPYAIGAALRTRRVGRAYIGQRRKDDHGIWRFRHHAADELARSRQRHRCADVLARTGSIYRWCRSSTLRSRNVSKKMRNR